MYPEITSELPVKPAVVPRGDGRSLLALSGALIFPGIGHFLVGCYYLGLFWFALGICIVMGIVSELGNPQGIGVLAVLVPLGLLVGVAQIFDALRAGRSSKNSPIGEPVLRFAVAGLLVLAAIAWQHRVISYLQNHVFEICYTPTPSMAPLLVAGDRFVTLKSMPINRWDIVGFDAAAAFPGLTDHAWMKRAVGLPGERVEITSKGVLINGQLIDMPADAGPYLATDRWSQPMPGPSRQYAANGCWGWPITLGPDEYFLLGDNSMESTDARYWPGVAGHQAGAMPRDFITCRVVAICWPPQRCRLFR